MFNVLVANSTPIVGLDSKLNSFLVKRDNKFVLPTPESPLIYLIIQIKQSFYNI